MPATRRRDLENFFAYLRFFCSSGVDIKLILTTRSETFGRFFGFLANDEFMRDTMEAFELKPLTRDQLLQAILRPTQREPISDHGSPYERYGFEFEAGLAERIRDDLYRPKQSGGF